MGRRIWTPALALGVALATGGVSAAADTPGKPEVGGGFVMTLGGTGTAAQAATADDTELAHYYRHHGYYGGYRGGYYGGYRGYYGGIGYGGYGGGYGYRSYYTGYAYRPYYGGYYGGYRPYYTSYYSSFGYGGFGYGYGGGYYLGCSDTGDAQVISLGAKAASNPFVAREPAPGIESSGGFRYDGGPANPVAQPKPDVIDSKPIGLQTKPAKPYAYKAYGEK